MNITKARKIMSDVLFEISRMPCSSEDFLGEELYTDAHELAYGYRPEYEDEDEDETGCECCGEEAAAEPHDCADKNADFEECTCCVSCVETICSRG